jgi:hypothetical protein
MKAVIPNELIDYIYIFYDPYKIEYNKSMVYIKSKYMYSFVMKQLRQFCIYNFNKELIYFAKDSILETYF